MNRAKAAERRVDAYSHISFRWHCKFFVIKVFFFLQKYGLVSVPIQYIEKADHSYQKPKAKRHAHRPGIFQSIKCVHFITQTTHMLFFIISFLHYLLQIAMVM